MLRSPDRNRLATLPEPRIIRGKPGTHQAIHTTGVSGVFLTDPPPGITRRIDRITMYNGNVASKTPIIQLVIGNPIVTNVTMFFKSVPANGQTAIEGPMYLHGTDVTTEQQRLRIEMLFGGDFIDIHSEYQDFAASDSREAGFLELTTLMTGANIYTILTSPTKGRTRRVDRIFIWWNAASVWQMVRRSTDDGNLFLDGGTDNVLDLIGPIYLHGTGDVDADPALRIHQFSSATIGNAVVHYVEY